MADSLVFHKSYYEALKSLKPNKRAEMYDAIMEYTFNGIEPNFKDFLNGYWLLVKPNIDASISRYDAAVKNGKKGGRPRKKETQKNPTETQLKPDVKADAKPDVKANQNHDKDKDKDKDVDMDLSFRKLYEDYLSESGHPPTSQSRIKSEQAWIELTDEEREIAVSQCKPFLKHRKREMIKKDGEVRAQFIPRVYTYLENKYFIGTDYTGEQVSVKQDIDPTTGTMVTIYLDKDNRRLNESQVYFDRDERRYYKAF